MAERRRERHQVAGAALQPLQPLAEQIVERATRASGAQRALASDGTWMVVEPFANDRPEQNHNPVGRVMYSASTMICVPHSLSLKGPALGAQAGEARLRDVIVGGGGFSKLRRAAETPFNLVLEARP